LITGSDGNGTPNEPTDAVNTSNGWAVDNGNIEKNESLRFSFVDDADNSTSYGVGDFKFQTEGYAGGISSATIIVRVYLDATMSTYDEVKFGTTSGQVIQISQLDWSAHAGTGNYVAGATIYGVEVISDSSNGGGKFRLDGVKVGSESEVAPSDLDFNGIAVTITDNDGDTATQTFNVHIDGTTGNQLTVEAIAGTSGDDTLIGTAGNDTLIGGDGDDIIFGQEGNDKLFGDAGNDTLYGGSGHNELRGGAGADTFVIDGNAVAETLAHGTQMADLILDYNKDEGDKIDLSELLGGVSNVNSGNIGQYAHIVADTSGGSGTTHALQVDLDGTGNASGFVTVAYLNTNVGVQILYHDDDSSVPAPTV
jgi:Ca2+-binding RTX toxin-like protein